MDTSCVTYPKTGCPKADYPKIGYKEDDKEDKEDKEDNEYTEILIEGEEKDDKQEDKSPIVKCKLKDDDVYFILALTLLIILLIVTLL